MKKITIDLSKLGVMGHNIPKSLIKKRIKLNKFATVTILSSPFMKEDIFAIYNKKQDKEIYLKKSTVKKMIRILAKELL